MDKLEISKQHQINYLREMSKTPGWKVLEFRIIQQLKTKKTNLENCKPEELSKLQGEIKSHKFILRQIAETKGSDKNGT